MWPGIGHIHGAAGMAPGGGGHAHQSLCQPAPLPHSLLGTLHSTAGPEGEGSEEGQLPGPTVKAHSTGCGDADQPLPTPTQGKLGKSGLTIRPMSSDKCVQSHLLPLGPGKDLGFLSPHQLGPSGRAQHSWFKVSQKGHRASISQHVPGSGLGIGVQG